MNIDIDIKGNKFVLKGEVETLASNKRNLITLKRLRAEITKNEISIPFEDKTKIFTLSSIQDFICRIGFEVNLETATKRELSSYNNEVSNFQLFSEKARKIRNDEFSSEEDLVNDFQDFKKVLEKKMKRKLYPLQMLSAFHMAFAQNSCNFAVPGAGKTSIVYGAYAYLNSLPSDDLRHVDKLLVIGPLSSFAPWENEYFDCFGNEVKSQRMSGDAGVSRNQKEQHLYSANPKELTLISHAGVTLLEREIVDFLKQNKTLVVVDEAHRIKNAEGVWGQSVVEIAKEATARVVLTGTPVPNGYEDLYNLYRFLYPFKYQDILHIHYDQLREMTKNTLSSDDERIKSFIQNINPYFIRIKKKDLKLPEIKEHIYQVQMDSHQREIYDFIEEKYIPELQRNKSGTLKDSLNKARLIRLRQAATNPILLLKSLNTTLDEEDPNLIPAEVANESINDVVMFQKIIDYEKLFVPQKFIEIKNLIETNIFPQNEKVIIWTIFIQNAEQLQSYLAKNSIKSELLIGRIPQEEREKIISKFNNPANRDFSVIIANPFSVSESISLHKGCHNAIYLERDYNAANFLQSKDRIHRVGLPTGTVTNYYYFVSEKSIDSVINERLDIKVKRMEKIIDEDIPLFRRINDTDETDVISAILKDYAERT